MEYQLYYGGSEVLLEDTQNSSNSKNSWELTPSDNSMDNSENCFEWNGLKIDEANVANQNKRKQIENNERGHDVKKSRKGNNETNGGSEELDIRRGDLIKRVEDIHTGLVKIPEQWHDDITSFNSDIIDSSIRDLEATTYTISDSTLAFTGLTAFKQEAPSPTQDGNNISLSTRQNIDIAMENTNRRDSLDAINDQHNINRTLSQLFNQSNIQNTYEGGGLVESVPQDQFNISANIDFSEDRRFQYVLAAATSIATKVNEDTLTYLNQGQSYEIKLKKLGDLSMYRGKMLGSVIRICFHERRLQYMEREQMTLWQKARPGDRILDVDVPLSYGAIDINQPTCALNLIQFKWDPTKEVGVYIKVNCISTEFTPKKHGGEKGVPFRIQVETYPITANGMDIATNKRLHAAACQIKVFKLKGADRKHKQDREKILKRSIIEQEKYQPSYECTVLNDLPTDTSLYTTAASLVSTAESETSSSKSNFSTVLTLNQSYSSMISTSKQTTSPMVQVVAPLQQIQSNQEPKREIQTFDNEELIKPTSSHEDIYRWLIQNRFQKFLDVFQNFNGNDLLRLSRNDILQICGEADGIRFFNVLRDRIITPKTTIYICEANSKVFNAVFLSSKCREDFKNELCKLVGLQPEGIHAMYMEGPNEIHIIITDSVVHHIKEESAFFINVLREKNDKFAILLKPIKQ